MPNTFVPKKKVVCAKCGWRGMRGHTGRKCPRCGFWYPKPEKQPDRTERRGTTIAGVTHRGTDGEAKAYMQNGELWIEAKGTRSGWLKCWPGVEAYFSPNDQAQARDLIRPTT